MEFGKLFKSERGVKFVHKMVELWDFVYMYIVNTTLMFHNNLCIGFKYTQIQSNFYYIFLSLKWGECAHKLVS